MRWHFKLKMQPIGYIKESPFKEKFATPRQSGLVKGAEGCVESLNWVQPKESLQGLEEFSHIWLVFLFHQNENKKFRSRVSPPRLSRERKGVFATRSPHRPNDIGMSVVELLKVDEEKVFISGLDLIEGTPILDIKPYIPEFDRVEDANNGWLKNVEKKDFKLEWSQDALSFLGELSEEEKEKKQILIEDVLSLDPRPAMYKDGLKEYKARLAGVDVTFSFVEEERIIIHYLKMDEGL